jgi:hypothetical protein
MYSEIVKGRLWAGPIRCLKKETLTELIEKGVVCVVSCLPIGQVGAFAIDSVSPKPKAHHVLVTWDDEVVDPERIDYAIHLNVPTLIHCNAGENRSTTLAACWLLKHDGWHSHPSTTWEEALDYVVLRRRETLRREPRVYDEMRRNIQRYAAWLTEQGTR